MLTRSHEYDELNKRVGRLENLVDRLLDPEKGIYAKLDEVETQLQKYALGIIGSILSGVIVQIVLNYHH
jgi:hypothetical protein